MKYCLKKVKDSLLSILIFTKIIIKPFPTLGKFNYIIAPPANHKEQVDNKKIKRYQL